MDSPVCPDLPGRFNRVDLSRDQTLEFAIVPLCDLFSDCVVRNITLLFEQEMKGFVCSLARGHENSADGVLVNDL